MIAPVKSACPKVKLQSNEQFLRFVPVIKNYARPFFRHLRPEEREDAICEVIAHAFVAFHHLLELGKQDVVYATPLARFAVSRYRGDRRVGSKLNTQDAYSWLAQRRGEFCLSSLEATNGASKSWAEVLVDDAMTPIPDQVAFRLDFADWLAAQDGRSRKLIATLAIGNTPSDAAQKFRVSRARISQLRRELQASWQTFQGDNS